MFDRIIKLSIGNPVFVNLLWLVVVLAGVVAAGRLPVEQFPEVSLDRVTVEVAFPGATAEDVEELVTRPIEDAIEDVADVKEVNSVSSEGRSTVTITFLAGKDLLEGRSDVEKAVSAADDLPEDAETPEVRELKLELPVLSLAILGDNTLWKETDRVVDELRTFSGVASVNISGLAERKLVVDLDQRKLLGLGLVPDEVVAAIRSAKANVPAGDIEREGTQVFVKTAEQVQSASDVARIPLRPGTTYRVADVATVRDAYEDPDTTFFVDGQPAIKLTVGRSEEADPLEISDEIRRRLPEFRQKLPPNAKIVVADDYTLPIRDRLRTVAWNAAGGGFLVLVVLFVLSGMRQALLALWGMPISYFAATLLMDQTGITVNVISTFGLLIATGIIVDDAIVVIENVQRHMEMGKNRLDAVFVGTREVVLPVTVAVATTMFAFLPLTMVSGTMGRVMKILPLVVIFCLIGSLIEAIFILPGHLHQHGRIDAQDSRTARLARRMRAVYLPVVALCARFRYLTVGVVFLGFLGVGAMAATMPFDFGAPGKPFELRANWELAPGTGKAPTADYGREVLDFVAERLPPESISSTTLRVGSTLDQRSGFVSTGANLGSIRWEFVVDDALLEAYPAMVRDLRDHLRRDPALSGYFIEEVQAGPPAGAAVTARLRGRDIAEINRAVVATKQTLAGMEGITDVRDNYGSGKETWRVDVDADRAALFGLTQLEVGQAIRAAVDGTVALEVSIAEESVEIVVRYAGGRESSRARLDDLLIPTSTGGLIRLDAMATIERTREVGFIRREDGQRTVSVLADIVAGTTTALQAAQDLETQWDEELGPRFPGIRLAFGGEADELRESLRDLPGAFALAVALIYTLLALQFGSYLQPIIIMSAVPFGLMGAVTGLFVMGYSLSLMALFGIVALAGICVNDSLVMIDVINKLRAEGASPVDAAIQGAVQRLRPILSTTLTTCLGLLPLAIGLGGKDQILAPMAVSIAAGLGVATGLILVAVPPIYLIIEDLRGLLQRRKRPSIEP